VLSVNLHFAIIASCHSTYSNQMKKAKIDVKESGLFGELDELTDVETEGAFFSSTSSSESDDFPKPLRLRTRGNSKARRLARIKLVADKIFPGFRLRSSKTWGLESARRSKTGFLGQVRSLQKDRVIVPPGTSAEDHIRILEENEYEKITVK
jgi:hypothetical protein